MNFNPIFVFKHATVFKFVQEAHVDCFDVIKQGGKIVQSIFHLVCSDLVIVTRSKTLVT